jgi:hypothetical protein
MTTMYATASDLASFLQRDVDTATATLVLTKMSALFDARARTHWGGTVSTTYSKPGYGQIELVMPLGPLAAVSAVRVAGVTLTPGVDYAVIEQSVFRRSGFGIPWRFPPDLVEVDYTYGYATVSDDVAAAVLESAAAAYSSPDISVASESIDDYSVRSVAGTGGMTLSASAASLADWYAGPIIG